MNNVVEPTVAEILTARENVERAIGKFMSAAQELAAFGELVQCDFSVLISTGRFTQKRVPVHGRSADELMTIFDLKAWATLYPVADNTALVQVAKRNGDLMEYQGKRIAIDKKTHEVVRLTKEAMMHLSSGGDLLVVPRLAGVYGLPRIEEKLANARLVIEKLEDCDD